MKPSGNVKKLMMLVALVAAIGGGYLLGGGHQSLPIDEHNHQQDLASPEKVQYTCSMHPFIIRDKPGACPICGMALTPIKPNTAVQGEVSTAGEANTITIDPVTIQNMGIRTARATIGTIQRTLRTVGTISSAEDRQFSLNSKIDGWVERLHVNQLGQPVKKGQALLEIYSPQLVAAQQEYLLALHHHRAAQASSFAHVREGSERLLEGARTRLRNWDISEGQIRQLEERGTVTKTLTLFSKVTGLVTSKTVLEGAQVTAGQEMLQITDISTIWVNADIYEYELPWVKIGEMARVELPSTTARHYSGKIIYLSPYVDQESRTVKARIEIANPGLELKPDMFATIVIDGQTIANTLLIPQSAVLNSGREQTVFLALGQGRFTPRQVKVGLADDQGAVQILSGLTAGDQVVVSAQFMLDSESRLREALGKMTAPDPTNGTESGNGTAPATEKNKEKPLEDLFQ